VPGVDVHDRERQPGRREGLGRQVEHDRRVLAAGEQQHGALELGRHLADDVDGLGFEGFEVGQLVRARGHARHGACHRASTLNATWTVGNSSVW
jgi:hypothetical protein